LFTLHGRSDGCSLDCRICRQNMTAAEIHRNSKVESKARNTKKWHDNIIYNATWKNMKETAEENVQQRSTQAVYFSVPTWHEQGKSFSALARKKVGARQGQKRGGSTTDWVALCRTTRK